MPYCRYLAGLAAGALLAGGIGTMPAWAGVVTSHPLAPGPSRPG